MRRRLALAALASLAAAGACTEVTTDPQAPVSLAFDSLPAPAIVAGDSLRTVDGAAVALTARAFNVDGDEIADAPVTFTVVPPDTTAAARAAVGVSPEGYVLAADTARAGAATYRIVAQVGSLQSRPTARTSLTVVPRPDSLEAVAPTGVDTVLFYAVPDTTSGGRRAVNVKARVLHDSTPAPVGVGPYLVRFEVKGDSAAPAVLDSVRFINLTRRELTTVATTATSGEATARLLAYPKAGATAADSVILVARAWLGASATRALPARLAEVRLVVRLSGALP